MSEDEVSESVELAWETGFQRGLAKGREEATKEFSALYEPAVEALEARIRQLEEALRPFQSGGDWGVYLAWLVGGAPTREQGVKAAQTINGWRRASDAALRAETVGGGDQT